MISIEECRNIEYEILGCYLEDLTDEERRKILGVGELRHWRADDDRSETNKAYYDYIKAVFDVTKKNFDWAKVGKKVIGKLEVRMSDGFKNDPLDFRFLRWAKKADKLQLQKGLIYDKSWRRRGAVGVFHNMARKWDRIENIFKHFSKGEELDVSRLATGDESIVETVADLHVYTGKLLTYFEANPMYREMLNAWVTKYGLEDISDDDDDEIEYEVPLGPVPPVPPE